MYMYICCVVFFTFYFEFVSITDDGGVALADALLENNGALTDLNLQGNPRHIHMSFSKHVMCVMYLWIQHRRMKHVRIYCRYTHAHMCQSILVMR